MIEFPKDFFWGAATSSYQVEGNNLNSDWWEWEKRVGLKEVSGEACRHYELYKEDFNLAKSLSHNAHRLSIEWSRIEPRQGLFLDKEIQHYRDVIVYLRGQNIEPIVTLHHFTNPLWFANLGGWESKSASRHFLNYVEKIVSSLSDLVRFWVTINEPMVYVYHAYLLGVWPPQKRSFLSASRVTDNLIRSHVSAFNLIHNLYNKKNLSSPYVSIAKNIQAFESCDNKIRNRVSTYLRHKYYNLDFLNKLIQVKSLDFIGINYYTRSLVDVEGFGARKFLLETCKRSHNQLKKNYLGWEIYPQGLYNLLLALKKFKLPIFILENGICSDDDTRWEFISMHLKSVNQAIKEGVKFLGYLYWSLIDNYEWDKGFGPRFGLIEVDYSNYSRLIRQSAKNFSEVCRTGVLQE